ncbi:MAG: protein kinase domain-containing protein [Vicinamibacteria bacterium]
MTPGTKIGHYEIVALLGAGGMGQVYRAHDTKLGRDVAIKVLPEEFTNDAERLTRFEREARLLAALNHPNVATLYGLEENLGKRMLAMELVEGRTLGELHALPLEEALPLFRQLAEGLEAAHEQGIIHRDLKPANIKVTPDGRLKILDFGLAKALDQKDGASDASKSPTFTRGTSAGVILGTAAYMSPEQARGKPTDRRTDVWAFGVVLYETLTGRRAFGRGDVPETLAAVLRDELDWSALPEKTPHSIRKLLRRCLERDPGKRLRDIGDARLEIEEAMRGPEVGASSSVASASPIGRRRRLRAWATPIVSSLLTGLAVWSLTRPAPTAPATTRRFKITAPPSVRIEDVALSPDGRWLAFSGAREGRTQVYLRAMDQMEAVPLNGSEGGRRPFFSPDAEWIGFTSGSPTTGDAAIRKVPRAGGTPVTISQGEYCDGAWGAGDVIVLGSNTGIQVVPASGGVPKSITSVAEAEYHCGPKLLPGGRAALFFVWNGTIDTTQIDVVELDTKERRRLLDGTAPQFSTSGQVVFAWKGSLWAVAFSPESLALEGEPIRLVERVEMVSGGFVAYAISNDESLVYAPPGAARLELPVWVERSSGRETPIGVSPGQFRFPRVSPDGTRIAFASGEEENRDVWLYDLRRSMLSRFTVHPAQDADPLWTPDGRRLLFHSHRDGAGNIYSQAADGTGEAERITTEPGEQVPNAVSPDGRSLVFWIEDPETRFDLYELALNGGGPPKPLLRSPANEASCTFSPNGRFIAYASDESGRSEIYVRPYPDVNGGKWQVSSDGGQAPVWNPRGGELFFRVGHQLRRVPVETAPSFTAGASELLFDERTYRRGPIDEQDYDVAPDGRRFLMIKDTLATGELARSEVVLVQNWARELKQAAGKN